VVDRVREPGPAAAQQDCTPTAWACLINSSRHLRYGNPHEGQQPANPTMGRTRIRARTSQQLGLGRGRRRSRPRGIADQPGQDANEACGCRTAIHATHEERIRTEGRLLEPHRRPRLGRSQHAGAVAELSPASPLLASLRKSCSETATARRQRGDGALFPVLALSNFLSPRHYG